MPLKLPSPISGQENDKTLAKNYSNSSKIVANALPTELGRRSAGQEISEVSFVCFMHHFTIEHDFINAMKIQDGN